MDPFHDKYKTNIELTAVESESIGKTKKRNIFSFTIAKDFILIVPGALACIINALCTPVETIVYGRLFTKLSDFAIYDLTFDKFIKDVGIYCIALLILGIVKLITNVFICYFWFKNGENQQRRVRLVIFDKILNKSKIEWIENFKNINGEITQLNRCVEEFRACNAEVVAMFIQCVVTGISLFIVAMYFSWSVTLVIFALTPVLVLGGYLSGKFSYKFADKENLYSSKSSRVINWLILNPSIPRLFNGKSSDVKNFNNLINNCSSFNYKLQNVVFMNLGLVRVLGLLMFVQGFWFGNTMIRLQKVDINGVFTAFSACLLLSEALRLLSEVMGEFYRGKAAASKLATFIALNSNEIASFDEASGSSGITFNRPTFAKTSPNWCNGEIELQNVSFKYNNKQEIILNNVDLKFQSNDFNFVIGKSGSGKSTLSQLIMNFYLPSSGKLLIDGYDITTLDDKWINKNITLIQLNPNIFNLSLKENLAMAILDQHDSIDSIPYELFEEVIEFSLLDKLVHKLGDDLNQPVSNSKLSGGEKQRISIARAKLRDTPILIIDEGLSALDDLSRNILFRAIKTWRQGKTTIYITHQLDQIQADDFVIIMEDGKVRNKGLIKDLRHEQLIKDAHLSTVSSRHFSISSEDSEDSKSLETKNKFSNLNYLKDAHALKDMSPVPIKEGEEIYGIMRILVYCLKTVDAKVFILLGGIFCLIHAVSNPIFSYLFARLMDNMVSTSMGINLSSKLKVWSCIVIGVAIINGVSYYLSNFLLAVASERWVNKLRRLSLMKINEKDLSFFDNETNRPSEINALLMNDTRDLRTMISKFLSVSITIILLVLIGSAFALAIGWRLSLCGLVFVLVVAVVTALYSRILQKRETAYKDQINNLEALNFDMINGIKTINSLNLKSYFDDKFESQASDVLKVAHSRALHGGISYALTELVTTLGTTVLLYYGLRLVGTRVYSRLQFLQVVTLLIMTFSNASMLMNELPDITRGQRCATYIMKLLESPSSPVEISGHETPKNVNNEEMVKFTSINFNYNSNSHGLRNVSFKIKSGDIFGIIGESGSGKSTIINLLTRLYGGYDGSITINNSEIHNIDVQWLREYISIVPQNPIFFEGTIYDNVTYGLTKEQLMNTNINEYLQKCNIESFVNSLPDGLQTNIGSLTENSLISTGQLQRLAIVRAVIRNPKILILDECTSNLDTQNFNLVKDLLVQLNKDSDITMILISHSTELLSITTNSVHISRGQVMN